MEGRDAEGNAAQGTHLDAAGWAQYLPPPSPKQAHWAAADASTPVQEPAGTRAVAGAPVVAVSCAEGGVAVSWAAPADGSRPVSHLSAGVVAPSVTGRGAAPELGAAGEGAGLAADRAEDGEDEAQHIGAAGAVGLVAAITLERLRETDGDRDATAAAAADGNGM